MQKQETASTKIGVAMIGCGGIALANHLPGLALCPQAKLTVLCDNNESVLQKAVEATGIQEASTNYEDIVSRDDVQAVIIATPNFVHGPIAKAAIAQGKHVLCEKPLAMNREEAVEMHQAAEAAGVRHMTAFTYRFVPAMQYMKHLVQKGSIGVPYHFRAQRFQDWGDRPLSWRQVAKLAGTGELGDMLSHRLDFGLMLFGPIRRLVAQSRLFVEDRQGTASDLEDWIAVIADFENSATGVFESTKLASGHGEGGQSKDYCEVNGSEGTLVYNLNRPNEIQIGRKGRGGLETQPVPDEFLKTPISPRKLGEGDPVQVFRYDQDVEFIDAILKERPCVPSFLDGARAQALIEACMESIEQRAWVEVSAVE